ncbi:MAG: HD domain-containing phosphohydrolase [Bacillota bacterium]
MAGISIRKKYLLIVGIILIVLLAALLILLNHVLYQVSHRQDEIHAAEDLVRLQNALELELNTLAKYAYDWSAWDDTYNFIDDLNETYIQNNLTDWVFENLGLNFLLFFDHDGEFVHGKFYDLEQQEERAIPPELLLHFHHDCPLLQYADNNESATGIIQFSDKSNSPTLVAAGPILTSDQEGPWRGTLVMGKYLDKQAITEQTLTTFNIYPYPENSMINGDLLKETTLVQIIDRENIAGFTPLYDINNEPVFLLEVIIPRTFYQTSLSTMTRYSLVTIGLWLIFAVILFFVMEKTILARLTRHCREVRQIGQSEDFSQRLTADLKKDELSILADETNRMLEQLRQSQAALQNSEARLSSIFMAAPIGIGLVEKRIIRMVNQHICDLLGYQQDELIGKNSRFLYSTEKDYLYVGTVKYRQMQKKGVGTVETRWRHKDGTIIDILLSSTTFDRAKPDQKEIVLFTALDITDRKGMEKKLKHISLHDHLTNLYNRAYFEEELKRLERSRGEYPVTIISADLDGLKLANDTMGHKKGDELLCQCAQVLRNAFRQAEVLARVGGDEFALILPRTDAAVAKEIVYRIQKAIDQYNQDHPRLLMSLSLGTATAAIEGSSLEELYREADNAMYLEKLSRNNAARNRIVSALQATLTERDYIAEGHVSRLQEMCLKLGQAVKLNHRQLTDLNLLTQVHDLGKVGIPDQILFKPGSLTEEEWAVMRQHSEKGSRIAGSSPDLAGVANLILRHHEKWDGSGYPLGIAGEEIPIECRILAIADAFDAMTNPRPYNRPITREEALREVERCAGTQFDPALVERFLELFRNPVN